jgi:hypothetical protein
LQGAPVGQAVPQAPQFLTSISRLLQVENVWPLGPVAVHKVRPPVPQPATHAPLEHVVPIEQALPHPPQLLLSVCGSTQAAAHCRSPAAHAHVAFTQFPPFGHCVPQPPQLTGSAVVSTHAPLQLTKGDVQATPQAPLSHVGVPESAEQTLPHEPQLSGSLSVRVHALSQRMPP